MILTYDLTDFPRSQREVADKAEALSFLQQYEGFVEWFDLTDADGNVIEVSA